MTHEQILNEFKYRSEVLWKASENPKTTNPIVLAELRAKARAYDEVIGFLEGNAE
jgi:hypothetical protein|nr:MAG TPA: hypothetical protein [Caudoviricetes sp.]